MSNFLSLPPEIRDVIYADVIPSRLVLVLPSSTSRLVPCPALLLVSRDLYHDSRMFFYRKSSIAFPPNRSALAELTRRPVRNRISSITILLPYWSHSRGFEVCDLSDEMMTKIVKLFKNLNSITLRLLMHDIRKSPSASKQSFFYPSFLKNSSWNFMITKACLDVDISSSTFGPIHHSHTISPLMQVKKLPKLVELDLRIRTSKSSHSTRRSIGSTDGYTSSAAHQALERVVNIKERLEFQNTFSEVDTLFPQVKVFRLWRLIVHPNHIQSEPIGEEEILAMFGGRAMIPGQLRN